MNLRRMILVFVIAGMAAVTGLCPETRAGRPYPGTNHTEKWAARHAAVRPWHAPYYHTMWGSPVALVVPPKANVQTDWGWGVSGSRMTPIYHQFARPYPYWYENPGSRNSATPHRPGDTSQFGVYYIRAPW